MATITITAILDGLRAADEVTRRFERRYWLSSADFYELYTQGLLDDGEHTEDFALWAGFYEIKLDREKALEQLSRERVRTFRSQVGAGLIHLAPPEPALTTIYQTQPASSTRHQLRRTKSGYLDHRLH